MDTSAFIKALAETLFITIGQSFVIVLFFKVMFKAVPGIPSEVKYKLWYSSLMLIFMLFLATLVFIYSYKNGEPQGNFPNVTSVEVEDNRRSILDQLMIWEERYSDIIALLYFAGVFIKISSISLFWYQIKGFRKNESLLHDREWEQRFTLLRKKVGVIKDVSLHVSNRIVVPLTIGFLKPLILVPAAMLNNLTTRQVEAILLHELAHIKRNDYLMNLMQRLMEAVLFFNPMVKVIVEEIQKEREYCCDEMVVFNTADPQTYANALLIIEEQRNFNQLILAATGNSKYPLLTRIKRLTTMKEINSSPQSGLVMLTAIFSIGISLAWVIPATEKEKNTAHPGQMPPLKNQIEATVVRCVAETTDTSKITTTPKVKVVKKNVKVVIDTTKRLDNDHQWQNLNKELQATTGQMQKLVEKQSEFFSSEEWKKHQKDILISTEEIKKQFDSPEWKKIQKDININAEQIQKHFNSPEWKKIEKEIEKNVNAMVDKPNSPELKLKQENLEKKMLLFQKKFETSPEWKKKQEEIERKAEEFSKKFENNPEWKKKQEDLEKKTEELNRKFKEDPEFQNKMKDLEKKMKEIGEKMKDLKPAVPPSTKQK